MNDIKRFLPRLTHYLAQPAIVLVRCYQLAVAPCLPHACRFEPTCSVYAVESLKRYGLFKGLWLAVRRLLRCHPFGSRGYDPVP